MNTHPNHALSANRGEAHTAGPWQLFRHRDGSMAILPASGVTICHLTPREEFLQDIPNFRLMSAAPELLAALGNLLARYDEMNEERWESNEDDRQTLAARALLAKLSGGAK